MEYSKYIVLLCLNDELCVKGELDPKEIVEKYNINNRQMWSYIKNLKEYYSMFKNKTLVYNNTTKKYVLY